MVETGYTTIKEALEWMYREAPRITQALFADRPPMNLAPEKVLMPWLITSKKHYTAGLWLTPEKMDKILYKG